MKLLEKFRLLKQLIIWYLIYLKDLRILYGKELGFYKNRITFPGISKTYIKYYKERLKEKVPNKDFSYSENLLYWMESMPATTEYKGETCDFCIMKNTDKGKIIYKAGYRRRDGNWVYNVPSIDPIISIRELKGYEERSKNNKIKNERRS